MPFIVLPQARVVRNACLLFFLGVFTCFCIAGFLTFVSFVILFFVIPFCLFLGVPIQVGVVILDWAQRFFQRHVSGHHAPVPAPRPSTSSSSPKEREGNALEYQDSADPVTFSPWRTPLRSAFGFKDTPSPFLLGNSKPLPPIHSDTLDQIRTPLIVSLPHLTHQVSSPNVLGLNLVESPAEYTAGDIPFPHVNYLETLSDKIIDEILGYLPSFYIGILALVSRDMAFRFRFRRIHSGTEYCPLSTFGDISRRSRLGDHTQRVVIHKTFYRPPVRTQWLLEGSDPTVIQTSWRESEEKKQVLLGTVLKSCHRISSLTWNETRRPLPLSIFKTVQLRLRTCLKHLDISANHNQLINYLNRYHDPLQTTFQLRSIVIRDGFTEHSIIAVTSFLKFSAASIRKISFKNSNFGRLTIENRPLLFEMLRELPRLEHVEFIRPLNLDLVHIPITHIGLGEGLALTIHDPITTYTHTPGIRFEFFSPLGHVLSNITTLILHTQQNHTSGTTSTATNTVEDDFWRQTRMTHSDDTRSEHFRTVAEVISAAVNLRVFAFNAPVPVVLGPTTTAVTGFSNNHLEDGGAGSNNGPMSPGMAIRLSSDILEALITREKLVSLSLMARVMTPHQLQHICENIHTLSHLGVYMAGESIHISKYSQHFTKLPRLIALDVAIRSFDPYCPCGHEMDPRLPHYEEGTAMGRLCRRFHPRVDMNGQRIPGSSINQHLKIVRLSRLGWHYDSDEHERIQHEINWLSSPSELLSQVESMWGPCEVNLSSLSFLPASFRGEEMDDHRGNNGGGDDVPAYSAASDLRLELEREAVRRIFKPVSWMDSTFLTV